MQLTLCPLFSGSSGNSVYVACGGVKLLVDAGVSATRVEANLREIGVDIREIDAILVTHEHVDHVRGRACSPPLRPAGLCQRGHVAGHCAKGKRHSAQMRAHILYRGGFLYRRAERQSLPDSARRGPTPSGFRLTVRDCAAAWRRISGISTTHG